MDYGHLKQELSRDEGYKTHVYRDTVGNYTIGIGHNLGSQPRMLDLTDSEISALFDHDVEEALGVVRGLVPAFLYMDDVRARALVNMAFNLGNRLAGFEKFLLAVNAAIAAPMGWPVAEQWKAAAAEMLDSAWARQVGDRATRLAKMIELGIAG